MTHKTFQEAIKERNWPAVIEGVSQHTTQPTGPDFETWITEGVFHWDETPESVAKEWDVVAARHAAQDALPRQEPNYLSYGHDAEDFPF